jgi:hypothetical protein
MFVRRRSDIILIDDARFFLSARRLRAQPSTMADFIGHFIRFFHGQCGAFCAGN